MRPMGLASLVLVPLRTLPITALVTSLNFVRAPGDAACDTLYCHHCSVDAMNIATTVLTVRRCVKERDG